MAALDFFYFFFFFFDILPSFRFLIAVTSVERWPDTTREELPIPCNIWEDVSMDFITGLPHSNGFSVIFVVDRLSKYAHFGLLREGFIALQVAQLFTDIVVKHHSFPKTIVSHGDSVFLSRFWQELFRHSDTSLQMSSAYHPQSVAKLKFESMS